MSCLVIPLMATFIGCNSNNGTTKGTSTSDSTSHTELNNTSVKTDSTVTTTPAPQLSAFLKKYYQKDLEKNLLDSNSRKFIYSEYDLNQDGKKETFIGLTGGYFCGSGGCTALLLADNGDLITKFTVAEYPFTISTSATNNWKDILIESAGKQHLLKFDGKTYPSNPSIQPEVKEISGTGDKVLTLPPAPEQWQKF